MAEGRLQRTREAYDREPTQDEINEAWAETVCTQRVLSTWRIYVDENGETHRIRNPDVFKVRG